MANASFDLLVAKQVIPSPRCLLGFKYYYFCFAFESKFSKIRCGFRDPILMQNQHPPPGNSYFRSSSSSSYS